MALWYKETGAWWDSTNLKSNDSISLEEERLDPNSLWNFYRRMIRLRQNNAELATGSYHTLNNNSSHVVTFVRYLPGSAVVVAINLSDSREQAAIETDSITMKLQFNKMKTLNANDLPVNMNGKWQFSLPAWGVGIWKSE
jgi:alpha-amylase